MSPYDLTKGRTSVYISHRLASTRFCDRILYLADGVIAEEGTHEALLLKKGKYAELFEIQNKITEIDCTYGLLDSDKPQATKDHANLVEYLLGALEQLETIFNK